MNSDKNKIEVSRSRRWVISCGAVVFLCALVFGIFRTIPAAKVPSYGGRSAESWLGDVFAPRPDSDVRRKEAIVAFAKMGPEGINFLVERIGRDDNVFAKCYLKVLLRLPFRLQRFLPTPSNKAMLAHSAALVLSSLSFEQSDQQPQRTLVRMVKLLESNNRQTRFRAASVIARYAQSYRTQVNVAPLERELIHALNDESLEMRFSIAWALNASGLGREDVLKAVQPFLTNADPRIRRNGETLLQQATNRSVTMH